MKGNVIKIALPVGAFAVALLGGAAAADWASDETEPRPDGRGSPALPVPVIGPAGLGPDAPPDLDTLSPIVGIGFRDAENVGGGEGTAETESGRETPRAPVDPVIQASAAEGQPPRFVDPCAGPRPGGRPEAGTLVCDEGEAASVVAALREPPSPFLIVVPNPAVDARYGRRCGELESRDGSLIVDIIASTPGTYELEWWGHDEPDLRRSVEVSSSDPTDPEHQSFRRWQEASDREEPRDVGQGVHHCTRLSGIEGEGGRRFFGEARGTDVFDREVTGRFAYSISVGDPRPPVEIHPLDPTRVHVSAWSQSDHQVEIDAIPLEGDVSGPSACAAAERGERARDPEIFAVSKSSKRRSGPTAYPGGLFGGAGGTTYPLHWTARLPLEEGRRHVVCVAWVRPAGASYARRSFIGREAHLVEVENQARFRLAVTRLSLEESATPGSIRVFARPVDGPGHLCGATLDGLEPGEEQDLAQPLLVCESGADTGGVPPEVDLVVRKEDRESITRLRLRMACDLAGPRSCRGRPTEWYRLDVPKQPTFTQEECEAQARFGVDCGQLPGMRWWERDGVVTLRLDYEDGPHDTDGFRFEYHEPYGEVEENDEPPPYPQVDAWTARTGPSGAPGSLAVRFRTDRDVTGRIRTAYRGSLVDRCGDVPAVTLDGPRRTFDVIISGLCLQQPYELSLDLVDQAGGRATYGPTEPAPFTMPLAGVSAGQLVRVESTISLVKVNPAVPFRWGVLYDDWWVSFAPAPNIIGGTPIIEYEGAPSSKCHPMERPITGRGLFEVGEVIPVHVLGEVLVEAMPPDTCVGRYGVGGPVLEPKNQVSEVSLQDLLAGTAIPIAVRTGGELRLDLELRATRI